MITNKRGVSFWIDENVLKLTQLCEHTKNHSIVHFKLVNCGVRELYLNQAAI